MRFLTISKPYVTALYRHKLEILQAEYDWTCGLICPPKWDQTVFEVDKSPLWIRQLPIWFNGKNHFHVYRNLEATILEFKPEFLNIEEEHYSLVTWQALKIAVKHKIPAAFYTWQNIAKRYPPPFSWIEQYVFRHCALAFAGNYEAKQILRNKGFSKPVHIIPQMGVDLERFSGSKVQARQSQNWDSQHTYCGYVGRLVEEKGVKDLVHAIHTLKDSHPNLRLVIVGHGPELASLKHLIGELSLTDRTLIYEGLPSQEIPQLMQALDLLILPSHTRSNWKEQFGRVLIEAMAASTVTIGSSSGEIPQVIGDPDLIFTEGSVEELVSKIHNIISDQNTKQQKASTLRSRAEAQFGNHAVAAQIEMAISQRS